jgi:predicted DNA-binding transcriptional regulator
LYLNDGVVLNALGLLWGSWQLEGKYVVRISNFSVVIGHKIRIKEITWDLVFRQKTTGSVLHSGEL